MYVCIRLVKFTAENYKSRLKLVKNHDFEACERSYPKVLRYKKT